MKVSMIAAHADDLVIGTGQGIPWNLPRDKQHFRSYTRDKAMLLGRKTFQEMTGWFTTQRPIVLTRNAEFHPEGVPVFADVAEAITYARERGEAELVVSGGAQVYRAALPHADELILTIIEGNFSGEATFPEYRDQWHCHNSQPFPADAENSHPMRIERWIKKNAFEVD